LLRHRRPQQKRVHHHGGAIWQKRAATRNRIVGEVCGRLVARYGKPRLGNPKSSIDDLVYIVISNKTSPTIARAVYRELKARFSSWDDLLVSPARRLHALLRPAGLWRVKSKQLRAALRKIRDDFGACDLSRLQRVSEEEAYSYLTSLPGVSDKVAKCVMLYTLGATVLPVDAHVHRVATRLGWTVRKRADQCHDELERLVPPNRRFGFHVDCVVHGRQVCRPNRPACGVCPVRQFCSFYTRTVRRA
jgi:endonuclease III